MNAAANANSGGADCQPKSWFAISIYKVDEKNKETYAEDVTIDLKIAELGPVQRVTSAAEKPVKVMQLNPGGNGDVLQITHDTDVYEAIGDFQ